GPPIVMHGSRTKPFAGRRPEYTVRFGTRWKRRLVGPAGVVPPLFRALPGSGASLCLKETLINPSFVIPAKAGIQKFKDMDSGLRRNDGLFRPSLSHRMRRLPSIVRGLSTKLYKLRPRAEQLIARDRR